MSSLTDEDKKRIKDEERYRAQARDELKEEQKKEKEEKEKVSWWKPSKGVKIVLAVVAFMVLINALGGGEKEKPTPNPTPTQGQIKEEVKETLESNFDEAGEVIAYASSIVPISEQVSEAMSIRSEILGRWPDWTNEDVIKFAAAGISLENSHSMARELTPPKIMVSVHQKMLKGLKLYAESVPIGNEGIDNLDSALIEKSSDLIKEGTTWMDEATKETEEIAENL